MVEELSDAEIEMTTGGNEGGGSVVIGIWDEWKWPWRKPPRYDKE